MLFTSETGKLIEINRMSHVTDPGYYYAVEKMYDMYITHTKHISSSIAPIVRMNNLNAISKIVNIPSVSMSCGR